MTSSNSQDWEQLHFPSDKPKCPSYLWIWSIGTMYILYVYAVYIVHMHHVYAQ